MLSFSSFRLPLLSLVCAVTETTATEGVDGLSASFSFFLSVSFSPLDLGDAEGEGLAASAAKTMRDSVSSRLHSSRNSKSASAAR